MRINSFPSRWGRPGKVAWGRSPAQERRSASARNRQIEAVNSLPPDPRGPACTIREREGPPRPQETGSRIAGTRAIPGAGQPGEGVEGLSAGTPGYDSWMYRFPLRPVPVGVKRPKEAHLFPTLKNLVPMATELAGQAGGGGGLPGSTGEGRGRGGGRPPAGAAGASPGRQDGCCRRRPPVPGRLRAPAAPVPARAGRAPRLPGAGGTEAERVSVLGRGTAWTLHLTALPNTRLFPAGRTGGRILESQETESGAGTTSSPEWARRAARPHTKGKACVQVPAPPTLWDFHPTRQRGKLRPIAGEGPGKARCPRHFGSEAGRGSPAFSGEGAPLCRSGNEFRLGGRGQRHRDDDRRPGKTAGGRRGREVDS